MIDDWRRNRLARKQNAQKLHELITFVEAASATTKAELLALATIYRMRVIDRSEQLSDTFYHPHNSVLKKRRLIFELLQAVQHKMLSEFRTVRQSLAKMQGKETEGAKKHWDLSLRSTDLWLVTLGASLDPKSQAATIHLWQLLDQSADHLPPAIAHLRQLEAMGENGDLMYGDVDDDHWQAETRYRPDWLLG